VINLVTKLIQERKDWLQYLEEDLKILVTYSEDRELVSLKYDQIESDMSNPLVCQCRGMVVDLVTQEVLAWPYNKFWNYGEGKADTIDWQNAKVLEKLDGSLAILYWHPRKQVWRFATSGHPTAGGKFGKNVETTFSRAIWELFEEEGYDLPRSSASTGNTYMFEYCSLDNRIVVKHDKPRLVLHGIRDVTGEEWDLGDIQRWVMLPGWECVQSYPISSPEQALHEATLLDPVNTEGFVVVDSKGNRVKIKSPRYVALHHLRGNATTRGAIKLWRAGEVGELLYYFPELAQEVQPVVEKLEAYALEAWEFVKVYGTEWPVRKDFALSVKDKPWAAIAFFVYGRNDITLADMIGELRNQRLSALERMIDSE
jgi:hypothetical protein